LLDHGYAIANTNRALATSETYAGLEFQAGRLPEAVTSRSALSRRLPIHYNGPHTHRALPDAAAGSPQSMRPAHNVLVVGMAFQARSTSRPSQTGGWPIPMQ
jgi:hypothetical protein